MVEAAPSLTEVRGVGQQHCTLAGCIAVAQHTPEEEEVAGPEVAGSDHDE